MIEITGWQWVAIVGIISLLIAWVWFGWATAIAWAEAYKEKWSKK